MLHSNIFYLFLITSLGYFLGNIKFKGFSLDISAVLIVALIAGNFGIILPSTYKFFGLAIFIYAVGLQSGPIFFETIKKNGLKLNAIASITIISIFALIVLSGLIFKLPSDALEGMFTGSMSSAPALAAALEIKDTPSISIIFGTVYPFCIIATMLFISSSPLIFKIDIGKEKENYELQKKHLYPKILVKDFKITNDNFKNRSIPKSQIEHMTSTIIERIESNHPDDKDEDENMILHHGDIVRVSGTQEQLNDIKIILGEELPKKYEFHDYMKIYRLLVTSKDIVGRKISDMKKLRRLRGTITKIRRAGIDISPYPNITLMLGDKLYIVAPEKYGKKVEELIGNNLLTYPAADFLPISVGIIIGIFVGSIPFNIPGVGMIKLSFVGGILITSLILGRLGRTGPFVWQLSPHSNTLMKTLGQLVFLTAIGTNSGQHLSESLRLYGFSAIYISLFAVIASLYLTILITKKLLKMNFIDIMGILSGAMTSTAALTMVNSKTNSDYSSVSYAAVYPFSLVLTIILSEILLKIHIPV